MSKITLTDLDSLTNETTALNALNSNFQIIQDAIDNLLSRDGTLPNSMGANLDMNSYRIQNLPEAVSPTEPVRYGDIDGLLNIVNSPSKWYSGAGAPLGTNYIVNDWYINTNNSDIYEKTGNTTWTLRGNIKGATGPIGPGSGDMLKSVYDPNNDGVVNAAAAAPWSGVTGKPTTLSGYGITDAQPLTTKLTNFNALNWAANFFPVFTGSNTVQASQITSAGLALLDDTDAAAQRTTLGLGTMALRAAVSTGDIVNGAATLAKLDQTGAAGLVLTAQGVGNPPAWASPAAATSGHVLLSTVVPTGITTFTVSGLTLSNYRKLYIVFNGVRPNTLSGVGLQVGTGSTFVTVSDNATSTNNVTGYMEADLENGASFALSSTSASGTLTPRYSFAPMRNASTSIGFRWVGGAIAFSASVGNIKIYGVL